MRRYALYRVPILVSMSVTRTRFTGEKARLHVNTEYVSCGGLNPTSADFAAIYLHKTDKLSGVLASPAVSWHLFVSLHRRNQTALNVCFALGTTRRQKSHLRKRRTYTSLSTTPFFSRCGASYASICWRETLTSLSASSLQRPATSTAVVRRTKSMTSLATRP